MAVRNAPTMGTAGSSWQHGGYSGQGNVAGLLGSAKGRAALVAGNADGVFDEVEKALDHFAARGAERPLVFAANDVGMYLRPLDHWASLHYDNLPAWKSVRWLHHKGAEDIALHSDQPAPHIDHCWHLLTPCMALSGMFAAQIAYLMGCDPIVLCGCPGTQVRRFFEPQARTDFGYGGGPGAADKNIRMQIRAELNRVPEFKERLRSMSGWSRDYLGSLEG